MQSLNADKSNTLISQKSININGSLLDLTAPKIMGIINVTPDSFFGSSRKQQLDEVLKTSERMLLDGATFLDIGGYSSRPGAIDISEDEEISRIVGPILAITKSFPEAVISVDTFRAEVARAAVESGAHVINDISCGLLDDRMLKTVGALHVPYIGMHMRGNPQNMKDLTVYADLIKDVAMYFSERIAAAREAGIKDFIVDPGFGFAKTIEQNFLLLGHVDYLRNIGYPILVGVSRKSMIYKTLNITAEEALNGTTVLNTVALLKGASILRVHDVREAAEAISLLKILPF